MQDSLAMCAAGVDALGFNFYSSSARYLDADKAVEICAKTKRAFPEVQRIGLFVDAPAEQVRQVVGLVDLDMLQFHGDESPEYCEQFNMPYIKVLGVSEKTDFPAFEADFASAWALLLDTHDPQMKGGTGRRFDWTLWPSNATSRLVLAGGLNAENVAAAVKQTHPFGVDVAGGVETEHKGVKDHAKAKAFIENAKLLEM
jgi:phosphoribosylanthranilate isomerase